MKSPFSRLLTISLSMTIGVLALSGVPATPARAENINASMVGCEPVSEPAQNYGQVFYGVDGSVMSIAYTPFVTSTIVCSLLRSKDKVPADKLFFRIHGNSSFAFPIRCTVSAYAYTGGLLASSSFQSSTDASGSFFGYGQLPDSIGAWAYTVLRCDLPGGGYGYLLDSVSFVPDT